MAAGAACIVEAQRGTNQGHKGTVDDGFATVYGESAGASRVAVPPQEDPITAAFMSRS